jgi:uncharacterized membrane protein YgcG
MTKSALKLGVLFASFLSATLSAGERISHFHSDIEVRPDRSLMVTETIDVIAQNATIRHGIYRDFPTVYPHPAWGDMGIRKKTGFDLLSVKQDGRDSPWHQTALANGTRLYIGDPNQYVSRGPHRYEIRYLTTRQLSRVDDTDTLRWNVNGQGWVIPSDVVSATVHFPLNTKIIDYAAWTGLSGSYNADVQSVVNNDGSITFTSTRAFKPYEGLTLSLALPPGTVAALGPQFTRLILDNFKWIAGLLLIMLLPLYYYKAWLAVGRDPQKGVVVADYHPVRNLSPAAHRFITLNKADNVAFSAAIINIAIKGFARIEQTGSQSFELHNRTVDERNKQPEPLTKIEKVVHKTLFQETDQITLGENYNSTVAQAKKRLAKLLTLEWQDAVYQDNRRYSWIGLIIGIAALTLCGLHLANAEFQFAHLLPLAIFLFVGVGLTQRQLTLAALLPAAFLVVSGLQQTAFSLFNSFGMIWLSLIVAILFVLFSYLLKAPTPFGQKILDEIEGFRLYLSTAEQHRLNILHPPDRTPELFEKLLPYAVALDVENQWSAQFSGILKHSTREKDGYQPGWYSGDRFSGFKGANFGSTLGSELSSSVASAATAPGSSSGGYSGGGGAGGGGGGGGGGGW